MADEVQGAQPPANEVNPNAPTPEGQQAPESQTPQTPANEGQQVEQTADPLVTPPSTQVDEVPSATGEDGTITYDKTGDAALDVALDFVGRMGVAGNDPAMVAAANGDFSLIEAKLATLGDKAAGWQQMVALAKDAYDRSAKQAVEASKQIDAAVLAVAGSKENWQTISTWAAANATPEEKAAINDMIDAGPVQARAAATILLDAYTKASGTAINPANPARNHSGAAPAPVNTRLSAREYASEVAALHRQLGSRMEASPEYKALQRRLVG